MSLALFILQFNQNYAEKTFIASLLLLLIILLWFGSIMTIWYFSTENDTANLYGGWPTSFEVISDLTQNIPRSSGIGRSAMIILIPLALSFLSSKSKINKLHYFIYFWVFFLIMTTQSRIVLLGLSLFFVVVITYITLSEKKLEGILSKITLIILIPFFLYLSCIAIKIELLKTSYILNEKNQGSLGNNQGSLGNSFNKFNRRIVRVEDPKSFTSRRFSDWQKILEKNTQAVFGVGTMGDRWLINQSASNLLLYNYSSSGIV
jgi:hypothetical protein